MSTPARLAPVLCVALAFSACDLPSAIGDQTRIVAAIPAALQEELAPAMADALEPRAFTVRDELVFDVVSIDPEAEDWVDLRKVQQVLVVGEAADPWVASALDRVDGSLPQAPAVLQATNVWARPQVVTIVLLPPGDQAGQAAGLMPEVGDLLLTRFTERARARMFVSGENAELSEALAASAGFTLVLPNVYRASEPEAGLFVFRNDQPDPSQLIRQITVARRLSEEIQLTPEYAFEWRAEVAERTTTPGQVTEGPLLSTPDLQVNGHAAVQAQGTWTNPPGQWPAGGPVISRLVDCGRHTFLVDGWLYAPGRAKYEYMVQIGTILDGFRCQELPA